MKQFIFFLLLLQLVAFASSCDSSSSKAKHTLNYLPVEDNENETYALWGADGQTMNAVFKDATTPVINGYFAIEEEDGMTLCKMQDDGYTKINSASGLAIVGVMSDGLIPVCKSYEHIQILNEDGSVAFSLDSICGTDVEGCYSYSCERMRVHLGNGEYVYVDKQGNQLFGKTYNWCTDFVKDVAVVNLEDNSYALINKQGRKLFTFDSDDEEKIVFSPEFERLATIDKDDRIIIYDFQGQQIGIYPSKVEEVAILCKESFIFENDGYYGLMAYTGEELMRAKYDALTPNGKYYLAIHEDSDEEVKLIDERGNILKTLDGEEIFPFRCVGYDFPNVIKRSDDEIYLVDDYGEIIGNRSYNYDFDEDDFSEVGYVCNLYFPQDEVLNEIMEWCGHGSGLPEGQNAFFFRDGNHCYPYEVSFINNSTDISAYKGKNEAYTTIADGLNHHATFGIHFDEPIARGDSLSRSAWLQYMWIGFRSRYLLMNAAFFNVCKQKLLESGCSILYSQGNDHILISNNKENLIILRHGSQDYQFSIMIYIYQNNESNIAAWIRSLDNDKKKRKAE